MKNYDIIIGIDPDVYKSGMAQYSESELSVYSMAFFDIFDMLLSMRNVKLSCLVVIEKGQSNKALFNAKGKKSAVSASIGMNTGRNFEVTNKIAEMCEYLKIDYEFYVPKSEKMTHDFLSKIVELPKRTNQDQRDAVRCILKYIPQP